MMDVFPCLLLLEGVLLFLASVGYLLIREKTAKECVVVKYCLLTVVVLCVIVTTTALLGLMSHQLYTTINVVLCIFIWLCVSSDQAKLSISCDHDIPIQQRGL